ncbi:hypothetical protein Tsumi_11040 [Porphyromonas miyakawae]|jgi:hypothetical protein|uniref:Sec translocon accessory complex subunit YajC n=1 Tax=Porphyromonas miyakawae TaxID=3137470 RepID=A0ABQ0E2W0_9PORP
MYNLFLLQAAGAAKPAGAMSGSWSMIIMMLVIIVIFYFFMIRPQNKKQKELQKKRNAMTNGDKVVTAGGIHGTIREVGDTYFSVEVAKDVRIKIEKTSVYTAEDGANTAK